MKQNNICPMHPDVLFIDPFPTMIKEYPNTDQRLAVCAVQYRKK